MRCCDVFLQWWMEAFPGRKSTSPSPPSWLLIAIAENAWCTWQLWMKFLWEMKSLSSIHNHRWVPLPTYNFYRFLVIDLLKEIQLPGFSGETVWCRHVMWLVISAPWLKQTDFEWHTRSGWLFLRNLLFAPLNLQMDQWCSPLHTEQDLACLKFFINIGDGIFLSLTSPAAKNPVCLPLQ